MSFTIPPIPTSIDTKAKSAQDIQGLPNPVPNPAANEETPTSAQVTFEIPFHMFQAFQEVVKKTTYLQGQEAFALLQAIDLWMQATTHHLDGNQVVFLHKEGMTTHNNLNPSIPPEQFQEEINNLHAKRKVFVDQMQAQAAQDAANNA